MSVNAIVSFALQRLGNLLIQEGQFLYGVSDHVQNIQTELRRMQCFLKDAESKASNGDERVRNWVAEIRELVYDAEDIIETYALKVESSSWGGGITNVFRRHKVGSEIKAITTKLSNLTSSLQTYGINGIANESSNSTGQRRQQLRRTVSHVVERNVVGRDESIEDLVKHLVVKNCGVASIWGMGGLGKTTLARKVYHHGEVRRCFDCFAWSCISQQCQPSDVWQEILIELLSPSNEQREEIVKLSDRELERKLYKVLQEKECLVILDDIWRTHTWDTLRNAFPYEETKSKILLTTRNEDVALHADPIGFHYKLLCLDEEKSWELLQKIAIPQKDGADLRMEELGKKMAKHCGGLPLAITVLGGLLATKYSSNEWHTVHETIKSCLRRGIGHGQEQSGVFDVLALSYNDLPTELKPCFLYLSHFPEDYEIDVDKLLRLWISEGIIKLERHSEEGEETLEDVAERYLNELVKRCMVSLGEKNHIIIISDGSLTIRTCSMHDLMRDFCLLKAKEENFLQVVNYQNGDENVDIFPSLSSGKLRRLAINVYGDPSRGPLIRIKHRHLRSLLFFFEQHKHKWRLEKSFFKNNKLLRILDLENSFGPPEDIGKLIHLRFLSLRNCKVCELPVSLGNLRCLQTLDLQIQGVVHIPNVLWRMKDLRHLYLPFYYSYTQLELRLGNLRNLQTLVNFSFRHFGVSELLNNMTNLRVLRMNNLRLINDFGETLKSRGITLEHLRSFSFSLNNYHVDVYGERYDVGPLVSCCVNLNELILCGWIGKLPDYHKFPQSITDLILSDTRLEQDPMPTLEKLPNLRTLNLNRNAFVGKQMICFGEGFPRLHSLILCFLDNLEEWRVDEGALPNLCHLKVLSRNKNLSFDILKNLPRRLMMLLHGWLTNPDGMRRTLQELETIEKKLIVRMEG